MQPPPRTVVIVTADVEVAWEEDFNRWYEEEHIPRLLSLPGHIAAERFVAVESGNKHPAQHGPKYMAWYALDSLDAYERDAAMQALLLKPGYAAIIDTPWMQRLGPHFEAKVDFYQQLTTADGLIHGASWDSGAKLGAGALVFRCSVGPADEAEFNRWYAEEHLPQLAAVPGVLMARRFRVIQGAPTYMARYDATDPSVFHTDAWFAAAETPWTSEMRKTHTDRWLTEYRRL